MARVTRSKYKNIILSNIVIVKDKQRMLKAMERQDILAKKAGNWNSNEVIRKWREKKDMF